MKARARPPAEILRQHWHPRPLRRSLVERAEKPGLIVPVSWLAEATKDERPFLLPRTDDASAASVAVEASPTRDICGVHPKPLAGRQIACPSIVEVDGMVRVAATKENETLPTVADSCKCVLAPTWSLGRTDHHAGVCVMAGINMARVRSFRLRRKRLPVQVFQGRYRF